jgi:hypothetical protein
MDAIETEKIVTTAEMFEIVGNELKEKNAEIEQLRKDKQLGFELMDVFIKEINRLKHMIAQYKLYDEGPRLDDRGDNLDGN